MKKIITIDAGTSNVRIRLVDGENITFEKKSSNGVKIGKEKFKEKLYESLKEFVKENNIDINYIEYILASGMITSPLGLQEIPHIYVPVSLNKISQNLVKSKLYEFDIYLIPGVKVEKEYFKDNNIKSIDVIRGEEVEVFGILKEIEITTDEPILIILPGSHNKFIEIKNKEIIDLTTTMSGEILELMTKYSILKVSVDENYAEELDNKFLKLGNDIGVKYGIGQGSFMLRGLDLNEKFSLNEKQNYLLGLILSEDIKVLEHNKFLDKYKKVIIAGGNNLAKGLYELIKSKNTDKDITIIVSDKFATIGALKIYNKMIENINQ
ncbi:MAG: 2-dehydro-3-deoxygalactonokinase [Fusobacteriaceae bacterium]|nr:2-dehydro-3-deoxygalactonokinase [Fusobacteriaceae bacterium]